jgi:hypothetical protein
MHLYLKKSSHIAFLKKKRVLAWNFLCFFLDLTLKMKKDFSSAEKKDLLEKYYRYYVSDKNSGAADDLKKWIEQKVYESHFRIDYDELYNFINIEIMKDEKKSTISKEKDVVSKNSISDNTQDHSRPKVSKKPAKRPKVEKEAITVAVVDHEILTKAKESGNFTWAQVADRIGVKAPYLSMLLNVSAKTPIHVYEEVAAWQNSGLSLQEYYDRRIGSPASLKPDPEKSIPVTTDEIPTLTDQRKVEIVNRLFIKIATNKISKSQAAKSLGMGSFYMYKLVNQKNWNMIPKKVWFSLSHACDEGFGGLNIHSFDNSAAESSESSSPQPSSEIINETKDNPLPPQFELNVEGDFEKKLSESKTVQDIADFLNKLSIITLSLDDFRDGMIAKVERIDASLTILDKMWVKFVCSKKFIEIFGDLNKLNESGPIRPPLGIKPHYIWIDERVHEVASAIARYSETKTPVPNEWYEELADLLKLEKYPLVEGKKVRNFDDWTVDIENRGGSLPLPVPQKSILCKLGIHSWGESFDIVASVIKRKCTRSGCNKISYKSTQK